MRVLRAQPVGSQHQLRQLLRQRGFAVAQPTLSRDLRELGVIKTPRGYVVPESAAAQFAPTATRATKLHRALQSFAVSIQAAGSVVVVKTPAAGAHPVARALDEAALAGVAGTIAGDDTVFIAAASERAARALARRLAQGLGRTAQEVSA